MLIDWDHLSPGAGNRNALVAIGSDCQRMDPYRPIAIKKFARSTLAQPLLVAK
jgi:hypothetical protein